MTWKSSPDNRDLYRRFVLQSRQPSPTVALRYPYQTYEVTPMPTQTDPTANHRKTQLLAILTWGSFFLAIAAFVGVGFIAATFPASAEVVLEKSLDECSAQERYIFYERSAIYTAVSALAAILLLVKELRFRQKWKSLAINLAAIAFAVLLVFGTLYPLVIVIRQLSE